MGSNTALTGTIINFSSLENVIINRNSSDRRWHPTVRADSTPKLFYRVNANYYQAMVSRKDKGYILVDLKNNVTTPTDSLATTSNDITSFRVTTVAHALDALVAYKTANASTGTWNSVNLITGIDEAFNAGTEYQYVQGQSGSAGIYYEMQVEVPSDGFLNVAFLKSASSSTDVTITVDGVAIDSNFDLSAASAVVNVRKYTVDPGTRLVRVIKNVSAGLVNLIGCNFSKLKDARTDLSIDSWGYYRHTTNYNDYITSTSANDYAVRDKDADLFGGSFHGGESGITTNFKLDGSDPSLADGEVAIGNKLSFDQVFTLDFSGSGGATLSAWSRHTFFNGGYALEFTMDGAIRSESFFTTLYGVDESFDKLYAPQIVDLSIEADLSRQYLGRQNRVVYGTSTGQYLSITHSEYTNEDTEKGGAYVYKVIGQYHKYYYAISDRGDRDLTDIHNVSLFEFG